ncbi:MAG: acetate--CoA ligase family protein [Deltaproteobacteria bacterium]|nr:acetate--CoA ligase family protein [Deltaproteobacteria bacterium]
MKIAGRNIDAKLTAREQRILQTIDSLAVFGGKKAGQLEEIEAINAQRLKDLFSDPEDQQIAAGLARRFFPALVAEPPASATTGSVGKIHHPALMPAAESRLHRMFQPRAVAILGASDDVNQVGGALLKALRDSSFGGGLVPIDPAGRTFGGLASRRSLAELGPKHDVDLAMITLPAAEVPAALKSCGEQGIKNVVVMSQGFESEQGRLLLDELREIAKKFHINLVGPNSLGIQTPALNASYATQSPKPGSVGLLSQSGAIVTGLPADLEPIGFSKVVALGNQACMDISDFAKELGADPETRVIAGYVEQIPDGRKFVDVISEVTRQKPVVMIKSGKSAAGAQASMSHTGSLGGSNAAYEAAFRRAGAIAAENIEELCDLSELFSSGQPLPTGRRVAIVTNTGGLGILAADEAAKRGLELPQLSPETTAKLTALLPPNASSKNPVDVLGNARSDRYRAATEILLADPNVDSVLCLVSPQSMTDAEQIAQAMVEQPHHKPIVCSLFGQSRMAVADYVLARGGVPNYPSTERAVRALGRMADYAEIKSRRLSRPKPIAVDESAVAAAAQHLGLDRGGRYGTEISELLASYGVPTVKRSECRDQDAVVAAAKRIGFPVAMKIRSPDIVHKSDVGGVALDIKDEAALVRAYQQMMQRVAAKQPTARIEGVDIQNFVPADREVIVGIKRDPTFGPMIMFGLGGTQVETIKDTVFELAPLDDATIEEMIHRIKGYPILAGTRGAPPIDFDALKDVLRRMSRLAVDNADRIEELEINPLIVSPQGAVACDGRAQIAAAPGAAEHD